MGSVEHKDDYLIVYDVMSIIEHYNEKTGDQELRGIIWAPYSNLSQGAPIMPHTIVSVLEPNTECLQHYQNRLEAIREGYTTLTPEGGAVPQKHVVLDETGEPVFETQADYDAWVQLVSTDPPTGSIH